MEAPFTAVLRYVDGCTEGQPVLNTIIQEGESKQPILGSKAISVAVEMFRRGDANSDLRVDISDAIRIFMHLFLGAASPGCLDAADANDDGRLDISDGLKILQDFFIPSTAISSPGPFTCGQDPTMDAFNCESYPPCS